MKPPDSSASTGVASAASRSVAARAGTALMSRTPRGGCGGPGSRERNPRRLAVLRAPEKRGARWVSPPGAGGTTRGMRRSVPALRAEEPAPRRVLRADERITREPAEVVADPEAHVRVRVERQLLQPAAAVVVHLMLAQHAVLDPEQHRRLHDAVVDTARHERA